MKALRLFVLLLLAVLLPVRGVVAATMPCGEPGRTSQGLAADGVAHHGMHDARAQGPQDAPRHHAHATDCLPGMQGDPSDGNAPAQGDGCHLCSSGCHAAALPEATSSVHAPLLIAKVVFPTLSAPAPAFQSDGQERPPRTI